MSPSAAPTVGAPYDLTGAFPERLTVLEASAGTGKTYALAALALRAVAERGLTASQLCVVTFTEAATAELRGRIRARLASAAAHLAADGGAVEGDDVLTALATAEPDTRAVALARLQRAVADLDAATISTIHGFCSRIVGVAPGLGAITDDDTDVRELVVDRFLRDFADVDPCPFPVDKVVEAVQLRLRMPGAAMFEVDPAELQPTAQGRAEQMSAGAQLVEELVAEARARRRAARRRTFDGLLVEARDALTGPSAAAAVAALRSRFRLVMIDEFQDTDAVQWDIFRAAFLDPADVPGPPVVIVGDPKQSIYRFRSAELSAYLAARRYAEAHGGSIATLATNRRSDAPLLAALEHVFAGATFGDPAVAFRPVAAAPDRQEPRLDGLGSAALQLRVLPEGSTTPACRNVAVHDLVAYVVALLEQGKVTDDDGRTRSLRAGDIGVLVRSNADAGSYAKALAAAGVPAARSSSDSVLDSTAADEWRTLLLALDRPATTSRAKAAALSWFVGRTPAELDALDDDGLADLVELLRGWAACLAERGLPALLSAAREQGLLGRVLDRPSGERDLTDLDHVAELLNAATGGRRTSAAALLGVLDELTNAGATADEEGVTSDVLARRIDRDDDTVKVLTVHKAKGLEFPVVLCPTLWTPAVASRELAHAYLDGRRRIDTHALARPKGNGKTAKAFQPLDAVIDAAKAEHQAEGLRLLYVALTRAKHRLVVWYAEVPRSAKPPLRRRLEDLGGGATQLDDLVAAAEGTISVAPARRPATPPTWRPEVEAVRLEVAEAQRDIDRTWAIWSFTGIEHAARAMGAHRSPDPSRPTPALEDLMPLPPDLPVEGGHDELTGLLPDDLAATGGEEAARRPLLAVPGGKAFGTLVHGVLEHVDFASPTLHADLVAEASTALRYRTLDVGAEQLADGLEVALVAPLGGALGATRLRDLDRRQRLDELAFDLPLGRLSAGAIAGVLAAHLPADDPLRPWAEHGAAGGLAVDVAGMVTGSIDLVARTDDGRCWLADYKTNRLPDATYDRPAMAAAMAREGYPLQATLYLVALHRYLRWRQPGYDPAQHLLGAAYLFLRGMDPDRSPADARGVYWFRPPVAALEAVDRLLADGEAA